MDSGRCKMAYDDNEEEYADFYDYDEEQQQQQQSGGELANPRGAPPEPELVSGGYEMFLPDPRTGRGEQC